MSSLQNGPLVLPAFKQPFHTTVNKIKSAPDGVLHSAFCVDAQAEQNWRGRVVGNQDDMASLPIAWLPENAGARIGYSADRWQPVNFLWKSVSYRTTNLPQIILVGGVYFAFEGKASGAIDMIKQDAELSVLLLAKGINMVRSPAPSDMILPPLSWVDYDFIGEPALGSSVSSGGSPYSLLPVLDPDKWVMGDVLEININNCPYTNFSHLTGTEPKVAVLSTTMVAYQNLLAAAVNGGIANRWRRVMMLQQVSATEPVWASADRLAMSQAASLSNTVVKTVYSDQSTGSAASAYTIIREQIMDFFRL